jgi:hypothetical protein
MPPYDFVPPFKPVNLITCILNFDTSITIATNLTTSNKVLSSACAVHYLEALLSNYVPLLPLTLKSGYLYLVSKANYRVSSHFLSVHTCTHPRVGFQQLVY